MLCSVRIPAQNWLLMYSTCDRGYTTALRVRAFKNVEASLLSINWKYFSIIQNTLSIDFPQFRKTKIDWGEMLHKFQKPKIFFWKIISNFLNHIIWTSKTFILFVLHLTFLVWILSYDFQFNAASVNTQIRSMRSLKWLIGEPSIAILTNANENNSYSRIDILIQYISMIE